MVDIVLKVVNTQVSVTSANTVHDCNLMRIYTPTAGGDAAITIKNSLGTTLGSLTMPAGFVEILTKAATDTIEANTAILCTPVAWK